MDTEYQTEKAIEWAKVYVKVFDFLNEYETDVEEENYRGENVKRTKLGFDTTKEVAALILVQQMEKAHG